MNDVDSMFCLISKEEKRNIILASITIALVITIIILLINRGANFNPTARILSIQDERCDSPFIFAVDKDWNNQIEIVETEYNSIEIKLNGRKVAGCFKKETTQ